MIMYLYIQFYLPKTNKSTNDRESEVKRKLLYMYSNINHNFISIWSSYEQHKQTTNEHEKCIYSRNRRIVMEKSYNKAQWKKKDERKKTLALKLALIFHFFCSFSLVM